LFDCSMSKAQKLNTHTQVTLSKHLPVILISNKTIVNDPCFIKQACQKLHPTKNKKQNTL